MMAISMHCWMNVSNGLLYENGLDPAESSPFILYSTNLLLGNWEFLYCQMSARTSIP